MYTKNWSLIREFSDYGFRLSRSLSSGRPLRAGPVGSAGMTGSCRFQIRLERVDRDLQRGIGILAPQFAAVEQHGVEPLRIVAFAEGRGVGKDVAAADRLDDPDFFARIARQPGVGLRMDVLGAHAVAGLEAGRGFGRAAERTARQCVRHLGGGELAFERLARAQRMAGFDLIGVGQAELDHEVFQPHRPFAVIGAGQINVRRQLLDAEAGLVDGPDAGVAHGAVEREGAALPRRVKYRLVRLRLDFAKAVHAAHVVDAVHYETSLAFFGRPVPIMQSRVTRFASFSSLQPSVPAGRIGSTMKRVSAVESQTRRSVPAGNVTPKSASTPRGSLTARDRYGADLYQTGGRPSTSHG